MDWRASETAKPIGHNSLTWLEAHGQEERIRALEQFQASLLGSELLAGTLGQVTTDYAECVRRLRQLAKDERQRLLAELEAVG